MVAQTEAQKKLLELYGHMALLDATHKTNKYGLPLFLLVVKTPYGYQVSTASCATDTPSSTFFRDSRIQ